MAARQQEPRAIARFPRIAILLLIYSATAAADGEPAVIQQRTNAIAELLVAKPAGFGRPAADREVWEKFAAAAAYRKVVPRAEKILKTPLPDLPDDLYLDYSRTGNRSRWQARNSKRRGRLRPLVLAECIENKGRFVPGLEELIRELSKERTWVMPAHDWSLANFKKTRIDIDLASAALAWELATADWLLGDKLSPATRKLIRSEIRLSTRSSTPAMRD